MTLYFIIKMAKYGKEQKLILLLILKKLIWLLKQVQNMERGGGIFDVTCPGTWHSS